MHGRLRLFLCAATIAVLAAMTPTSVAQPAEDKYDVAGRFSEFWPYRIPMPGGVVEIRDIEVGRYGDAPLEGNLIFREATPSGRRPAIVFVHGGGWAGGDRYQFMRQAMRLAARLDVVGLLLEYRLAPKSPYPAGVHDVKCAVRYLRSVADRYRIDPDRIGLVGGSAGAHLSSLAAVTQGDPEFEGDGGHAGHSSDVSVAVLFNGEFDLVDIAEHPPVKMFIRLFMGGTIDEVPDRYEAASPVRRLSKDVPPMLFLHGTADEPVPFRQAVEMHEKLTALGVHSELELYEGMPHAWFNKDPAWRSTCDRVERFLLDLWRQVD